MAKVTKSGWNPVLVVLFFVFCILVIAGAIMLVRVLMPETYASVFGDSGVNESLVHKNKQLQLQLNQTQSELGSAKAEILGIKSQKVAWGLAIGIGVALIIIFLLWYYLVQKPKLGLKIDEAWDKFKPRARRKYGFSESHFPQAKPRQYAVERIKHKSGEQENEFMYFLEYEFHRDGEENQYVHGLKAPEDRVVTVAITNKTYEYRQQWFPFLRLEQAIEEAHRNELWGFALQKSKMEEDVLEVLQSAKSLNEAKESFQSENGMEAAP